jgi:hypothetical protein
VIANDGSTPDVSPKVVQAVIDGQRRPQPRVDPGRLREIWSAGAK